MQISSLWTNTATRTAAANPAETKAAPSENPDPLLLRQTQAEKALAAAKSIAISSPADQKARAAQKLADAKQELEALKMWVSDPEVLARLAQQLAAKIGAAANQFASGMAAEAGAAASGAVATANAAATAAQTAAADVSETAPETGDETRQTFAQRAYQEVSADAPNDRSDQQTMDDFKSVARQVKALLEKARRALAEQKATSETGTIDKALDRLDTSIDTLSSSSAASAMTGAAGQAAIPLSITV